MFKHYDLYKSYILLIKQFSTKDKLVHLLAELDKKYVPNQLDPIYKLLWKLN